MISTTLRRKLFYVPLAMHLSLQGCAAAQLLAPAAPPAVVAAHDVGSQEVGHAQVIDTGLHGSHAITVTMGDVVLAAEHAYKALNVIQPSTSHRWVPTDIVKYALSVRSSDDGFTASIASADLSQKGSSISTQATFTGLSIGKTYKVYLQTYGNKGGDVSNSLTLIDDQHAQASNAFTFTNTLNNDIQDSYTVTLAPTLNDTVFNGQIGVSIAAPTAGNYTTTLTPTVSVSSSSSYTGTFTLGTNYSYFGNGQISVSVSNGTLTLVETRSSSTTTLVGAITGVTTANIPGHTFVALNSYEFVLDGSTYSDS